MPGQQIRGAAAVADKIVVPDDRAKPVIALIGNPNVGKSVIFSSLTRRYVSVSNYPGTTVELSKGSSQFQDGKYTVVDTPGINSLTPHSEDELVARNLLLDEQVEVVIQVADMKNLRRALLLTMQLGEMGLPMVLVLNMKDEANQIGLRVNARQLSEILDIPVVETIATEKVGIPRLIAAIHEARPCRNLPKFDGALEKAVTELIPFIPQNHVDRRALSLMLLGGDETMETYLVSKFGSTETEGWEWIRHQAKQSYSEPISYVIARSRTRHVSDIHREVVVMAPTGVSSAAEWLGRVSQHPVWGVPFLFVVLFLMYEIVGVFGAGTCVNWIENDLFGGYINPAAIKFVEWAVPIVFLQEMLVDPNYGLITVGLTYAIALVLPIVGFFFIAFGILEDSGYLPRLAIMANRVFKVMGLNGKAVLPMVLGLGCDTMATLTTRILETKKERLIAITLLALAVPCSAQLGVIMGILGQISISAYFIFIGVIVSQLVFVGALANWFLPGETSDFMMEIPPFRMPKLSNVLLKTLYRIEWFLKEAVPLFLIGTLILFLGAKSGILDLFQQMAQPVVQGFLGLPSKTAEVFVMGFLRRDYGAAGLFNMFDRGEISPVQAIVTMVTITLFMPCIANFFVIIKEQGIRRALIVVGFVFPYAILVGGCLNAVLRWTNYTP